MRLSLFYVDENETEATLPNFMLKDKINLASQSPRRRELIGLIFNNINILSVDYDEPRWKKEEAPLKYLLRCVKGKWGAALENHKGLFLGEALLVADTVVVLKKRVLGKPTSPQNARQMLQELSGQKHRVLTAFQLGRAGSSEVIFKVVATEVSFLKLSRKQIDAYVRSKEPMDKAGSYGFQGLGMGLIRSVRGPYTNVMGLPVLEVERAARELGLA